MKLADREPTTCGLCNFEQVYPNDETAARGLARHRQSRHGEQPAEGVVQLSSVNWRERAIEAIRQLAARPDDFFLYEVHNFGVGEPPANHRTAWGLLSKDIHRLGVAHPVDWDKSIRPDSRQSAVRKWSGDVSRCVECAKNARGASA